MRQAKKEIHLHTHAKQHRTQQHNQINIRNTRIAFVWHLNNTYREANIMKNQYVDKFHAEMSYSAHWSNIQSKMNQIPGIFIDKTGAERLHFWSKWIQIRAQISLSSEYKTHILTTHQPGTNDIWLHFSMHLAMDFVLSKDTYVPYPPAKSHIL